MTEKAVKISNNRPQCSASRPRCPVDQRKIFALVVFTSMPWLLMGSCFFGVLFYGTLMAATPKRFLDRFIQREEPTPKFINVPKPPPATADEIASSRASMSSPSSEVSISISSWDEMHDLINSVSDILQQAASDAIDPSYKKKSVLQDSPSANPYAVRKPTGPQPPKSRRLERLRVGISRTLNAYQRRPLNTAQHSPWEIMHGFVAFGIPSQLRVGGPRGTPVNAIGWMNMGGRCRGQVMLVVEDDHPKALYGVGLQGHSAQYLAILAQCRVSRHSPITLNSQSFTVSDLIEEEKLSCKSGTELTFALISLAHYLHTDSQWESRDGQLWSIKRLMEEEIEQPIRGVACGGTHRLFGLSYGCQRRLKATGQLDGVYRRADKYVRDYQVLALSRLLNRDGSFSTEWFKYPADRDDDIDRKVQTTGHILEWLVASLDQEMLYHSRVIAATEFLTSALAREVNRDWRVGPLGHALHALSIYQERVWGVVMPGNVAAFHGPMKATPISSLADRPEKVTLPKIVR